MGRYRVLLTKKAAKQLDKLADDIAESVIDAIEKLSENPRPPGCKKLKGRDAYRIRKGNYRVIYNVFDEELIVDIIAIGHRRGIYN